LGSRRPRQACNRVQISRRSYPSTQRRHSPGPGRPSQRAKSESDVSAIAPAPVCRLQTVYIQLHSVYFVVQRHSARYSRLVAAQQRPHAPAQTRPNITACDAHSTANHALHMCSPLRHAAPRDCCRALIGPIALQDGLLSTIPWPAQPAFPSAAPFCHLTRAKGPAPLKLHHPPSLCNQAPPRRLRDVESMDADAAAAPNSIGHG
jgi:hypothetical protein